MATKLMGRDDGRAFGLEKKQEAFGMGEADMMDAEDMQAFAPPPPSDFVPVRVYAHAVRSDRKPGDRRDFTETLCWVAAMKTDANSGVARIQFDLNDSITKFRATAEAFTASGAIGSGTGAVESREPFYIEPKLPLEVTAGDEIHLPVNLVNGTGEAIAGVAVHLDVGEGLQAPEDVDTDLAANQRGRRLMTLAVLPFDGESSVRIQGTAGLLSDTVTRKLMIKPRGFPRSLSFGGYIGPANEVRHEVVIPDDTVPNSVKTSIRVYPAPLANLTGSLERLIREPNGCFEQTSSTNYPLVMAQEYFTSHQDVDPSLVSRSRTMLKNGYDRLIGFECSDGGYEWFGENPGHEALTAYGLMEFTDMVDLIEVDKDMLGRTRNWLLGIRDGSGGFKRERRALHTWVTDPDASNAYITWALVATGQKDLEPEIDAVKKSGGQSENAYVKALAANVLCEAGQGDGAASLLDNLATGQADDGHVAGGTTSIVGSRGESLDIETTALATLAWLKSKTHTGSVEKAIRYLATSCEGGRYGSTQSTVLALKAIVAHDMARARPGTAGSLRVFVGDQPVGGARPFDADTADGIDLPDVGELLSPGKHELRLMMEQGSEMPYSVEVLYNTLKPDSSAQCRVSLTVELVDGTIDEGAITEARVVVRNRHSETIPTPVAIVGIPGGLEVRHDQLKELVKTGIIAAFEVRGRQVILYWRSLDADQKVNVPLSLVAAIPGVYCGPASRAYEYYTDEHKVWAPGLEVTVTPRQ